MAVKKHHPLKLYKTYPFKGQDPVVAKVLAVVDEVGIKPTALSKKSSVASGTTSNWRKKKTMRPQFVTLNAILRACGKTFKIEDM